MGISFGVDIQRVNLIMPTYSVNVKAPLEQNNDLKQYILTNTDIVLR